MSDRLNRLKKQPLRPRLAAQNIPNPSHADTGNPPPDLPANKIIPPTGRLLAPLRSGLASVSSRRNFLRPPLVPVLPIPRQSPRSPGIRAEESISVEGQWENTYNPAQSTARFWGLLMMLLIVLVWGAALTIGFQAAVAILMGLGLILAVIGLLSPSLGVLAIGMLAALDSMASIFLLTGGILRYNTLNYWLLIVMALVSPLILRLRDINSRALQAFLLLLALEISFSSDINRGFQDVLNIGVTFGMVVYFARGLKDELSFYWLGLVNGLLAGLGGLIFFLQASKLPYANPNDWTYFNITALFSICVAYPFAIKYHKDRLLLLAFAAVNFAWVFLSGSRGSLLVAALCGVYLFLATRSITWKALLIAVAFLIGVWVTANFVEQQSYMISRIQMLFDPRISESKRTSQRSVIAEAGLRIFRENPLGIGTGSFEAVSQSTNLVGSSRPAHSAWIKVLAENGVPGIVLMTVFITSFAIAGLRQPKQGRFLLAMFITLALASAFIAKEFRGKSLWFLVAAGIVLLHPEQILASLYRRLKENDLDYRQKLREIRFGRKR